MIKNLNNKDALIISHIADIDGMGSIILGNYYFKEDFDYILCEVVDLYEVFQGDLRNYKTIYVCDLSIENEALEYLKNHEEISSKLKHFDHHESALNNNIYPFINVVVEENGKLTCGTELFYNYLLSLGESKLNNNFFKEMVESIRSNDTWDFVKNGDVYGGQLATLHALMGPVGFIKFMSHYEIKEHFYIPESYLSFVNMQEEKMNNYIKNCVDDVLFTEIDGYHVGVSISEEYRSQVGNAIATAYQDKIDFVLIINFKRQSCSLRGIREDIDLGEISMKWGTHGGGHKKAAGFSFDEKSIPMLEKIVEEYFNNKKELVKKRTN